MVLDSIGDDLRVRHIRLIRSATNGSIEMVSEEAVKEPSIGSRLREFVDNHRLTTYFLIIEAVLVFLAWYLDTWTSVVLGGSGEDISDITAGLLGGWAVVFGVFGFVGVCFIIASHFWVRFTQRLGRSSF